MGGAGDPPAPVGDPPTGTAASIVAKRPCSSPRTIAPVPSGESPDGTGGSPVLPANHFSNTLLGERTRKTAAKALGRQAATLVKLFRSSSVSEFPTPEADKGVGLRRNLWASR